MNGANQMFTDQMESVTMGVWFDTSMRSGNELWIVKSVNLPRNIKDRVPEWRSGLVYTTTRTMILLQ